MINFKKVLSAIFAAALMVSSFSLCASPVVEAAETATDTTYSLPLDTTIFTEKGQSGQFRLAALNPNDKSVNYCKYFPYSTQYKCYDAAYYNATHVIFQKENGKDFRSQIYGENSGDGTRWGSVIEFTAPANGIYEINAEFKRQDAPDTVGEYYLIKGSGTTVDFSSSIASLTQASGEGQNVLQTLNGKVVLEEGEKVWFINKIADGASYNVNKIYITDFSATIVSAGTATDTPEYVGANFNPYGLNLFFDVPEDTTGFKAVCTFADGTTETREVSATMFFSVPAKQVFDNIKVEILDANDSVVETCETSVALEAKTVLDDASAYADEKAFAQATLALGTVAKEYFKYEGTDAFEGYSPNGPTGSLNCGATYVGDVVGIEYSMFNVRADEKFYFRHHFTVTGNVDDYTVTVGGVPQSLSGSGQNFYAETEVAAGEFDKPLSIVITNDKTSETQTVSVSVYSYIQRIIEDNDSELLPVANALYDYNVAATEPEPSTPKFGLQSWVGHSYDKLFANQSKPAGAASTYTVYATKAETEGASIGLIADKAANVTLRVMNNPSLHVSAKVYWIKESMTVAGNTYTDPAVSITGRDTVSLAAGKTTAFLVEFTTTSSTPAGDYVYNIGVYDDTGSLIKVIPVTLHVWNFALPEEKTFETTVNYDFSPLYNQYALLLEHNLSGRRIPYDLSDEKANEYMSNPKVTSFVITFDKTKLIAQDADELARLDQIYRKLKTNPDWLKKAFFYVWDEPVANDYGNLQSICEILEERYPDIRRVSAYYTNEYSGNLDQLAFMDQYVDIHCPKLSLWDDGKYTDFASRIKAIKDRGDTVWAYVCNYPVAPYLNVKLTDEGLGSRVLFWQMYQRDVDGFLYWHADYWDMTSDPWTNPVGGDPTIYGDGILTYPSEENASYTVPSIRLKLIRDGIDDIELMYLAEQVLGESWAKEKAAKVSKSLQSLDVTSDEFAALRVEIGNAIEDAMANSN